MQSPGAVSGSTPGAESSRDTLDMRYSLAALADDYTKRKHVVRVTTAAGAELLLQVINNHYLDYLKIKTTYFFFRQLNKKEQVERNM